MIIRDDGAEREVTAAQAFLLHMAKRGLEGDGGAARAMLAVLAGAEAADGPVAPKGPAITVVFVRPGSVNGALSLLRMGAKLDRRRPTARMVLEPWIVEAALRRLGERRLTRAQQSVVWRATRTPHRVAWPTWWGTGP